MDPIVHKPLALWFQGHVLDWLEKRQHGQGESKHLAVVVHREIGKTSMLTVAGQAWLHVLDNEISTFTGSEKTELSEKFLSGIKGIMDGSDPHALFCKLYGDWSTDARQWKESKITHSARKNTARPDPSLGTFAVEKSIVGAHPDAIFYDDPISYERLKSDSDWLQRVNSQITSLTPVLQSDGLMIWVGTRYDDEDHFGVAFRDEGIKSITGMETDSITTSPTGLWDVYFMAGRDMKEQPTTPKVWPESRMKRYQKQSPLQYAAQILNDPSVSELNPITPDQIRQCIIKADQVPWSALRFAICTDVAFSDGRRIQGKDETVFIVHGYPRNGSGDVYIIEGHGSNLWREEDFGKRLVAKVQQYRRQGRKVFAITGEKARAGLKDVLRANLRNKFSDANEPMPNYIEFERGKTDKYDRLHAATTFWVDGHVRVVENGPNLDRLMSQVARIGQYAVNPRVKIDWADAHSDAFQPELYQPMRRAGPQKAPWEKDAQMIETPGIDPRMFEDDDWRNECPRPPIR